ncbi:MAG: hypothetical protein V9G19_06895 [Tetrasphaera sp.]
MTLRQDLAYEQIRAAIDAAEGKPPEEALPQLRAAAEQITELIDESLAAAVLDGGASLRAAGAAAGLTENAVGPRLARTRSLAPYANESGRVTADGVRRAQYDAERGMPPPASTPQASLRFKPRRRAT